MPIKQYLPTKKFSKKIGIILGVVLAIFIIKYADFSFITKNFSRKAKIQNTTLKQAVFVDTDNDGVADWEEALWGTDPKKVATYDGVNDLDYITKKRESLAKNTDTSINETDKLSQEFFSSLVILKDSGALTEESANILAMQLADKITSDDNTLPDAIASSKIVTTTPTIENKKAYLNQIKTILSKYDKEGAGSEISILAYALQNNDRAGAKDLEDPSKAYIALGGALAKMKVPSDITETHRHFTNDAIKVGIALKKLELLYDNATMAMPGIIQYQKYSDEFNSVGEQLIGIDISNQKSN